MLKTIRPALLGLFLLGMFVSGCELNETQVEEPPLTIQDEKALGENILEFISSDTVNYPVVVRANHLSAYQYLDKVTQNILSTNLLNQTTNFDWEVIVLDDDSRLEAFATPGGKWYVYTGLLRFLENEAQLAALVTHGFILSGSRSSVEHLMDDFDNIILIDLALGSSSKVMQDIINTLTKTAYPEAVISSTDRSVLGLLCASAYDAQAFIEFLQTAETNSDMPKWLELHPGNFDRTAMLSNELQSKPCAGTSTLDAEYQQFLALLP